MTQKHESTDLPTNNRLVLSSRSVSKLKEVENWRFCEIKSELLCIYILPLYWISFPTIGCKWEVSTLLSSHFILIIILLQSYYNEFRHTQMKSILNVFAFWVEYFFEYSVQKLPWWIIKQFLIFSLCVISFMLLCFALESYYAVQCGS